jgi:hypothetical protein
MAVTQMLWCGLNPSVVHLDDGRRRMRNSCGDRPTGSVPDVRGLESPTIPAAVPEIQEPPLL